MQVHILDEARRRIPPGAVGELYIGGAGVARGYLNRPDLTAERFVPDPFAASPGARLYRSGDLGRLLPDGTIAFLGRADEQIKVRGFRIEPHEVVAALETDPSIRASSVVAREDEIGERRLVAYVVPSPGADPRPSALAATLRRRLPDYMIPAVFVRLDALPLTPNGKVDRAALPAQQSATVLRDPGFVPARGPLKRQLAELWEDLLGVHPVGATDDFFELGGHSLLAVRLVHRIEEVIGTCLPVALLHTHRTIEQLARAVVGQDRETFNAPIITLQKGCGRWALFFFHGDIAGGGFYCRRLAHRLPDRSFHVVHSLGLDGREAPATIENMAEVHVDDIRSVQRHGPYLFGGYCNGGLVAWETARRLETGGERVPLIVLVAAPADTRFAVADVVLAVLGRTLGQSPAAALDYFARLRFFASRWTALPTGSRLPFAVRAAKKLFAELAGRRPCERADDGDASAVNGPSRDLLAARELSDHYWRAATAYRPRRRKGRVLIFWPSEETPPQRNDPTIGWGRLADHVEAHATSGGHDVIVTHYAELIADRLRASLAELGDVQEER